MSNVSGEEGTGPFTATSGQAPMRIYRRNYIKTTISVVGSLTFVTTGGLATRRQSNKTRGGEAAVWSTGKPYDEGWRESRNKEPSFAPRVREHRLLETVFPVTCGDKSFYMRMFFFHARC